MIHCKRRNETYTVYFSKLFLLMKYDHLSVKKLHVSKNPFGFGVNDLPRPKLQRGRPWIIFCPFYTAWHRMLKDCYGQLSKKTVCEEWKVFSVFHRWVLTQSYEGRLLVTVTSEYNPDTSVFIPKDVVEFIEAFMPEHKLPFEVSRRRFLTVDEIKRFDTQRAAVQYWREWKLNKGIQLAQEQTDPRIALVIHDYLLTLPDQYKDVF